MGQWKKINLEKCIDSVKYPSKIPKKNFLECGKFPIVSQDKELISGYWMDEQDLFIIDKPIIVFGDHTKNIKYIDFNFVIGADGVKILQPKNFLDPKFLYYFLLAYPVKSLGYARHYRLLKETDIIFPELISEQKRIVEILDKAFEGIDRAIGNTEKNLANARELFDSYLNNIFIEKGEDWVESTIGKVCTLKSGTTVKKDLVKDSGEIAYVKVINLTDSQNKEEITTSSHFLLESDIRKNSIFPVGTTIFPKRGGAIQTNKKRITSIPICADLNIMGVIPSPLVDSKFLYFYFLTVDMKTLGSGSSVPQINNYDISPLIIPFPQNREKQVEITKTFEALTSETQRLETIYQQKLQALQELKQSLLHKAFTRELTNLTVKEVAA